MMATNRRGTFGILLLAVCALLLFSTVSRKSAGLADSSLQRSFPDPPNDLTRVYYLNAENKLLPIPFEPGITSLNVFLPAQKDQVVQVHLKGSTAATILANNELRFFVFVTDKMDPPPQLLVRLTRKQSGRELTISVIKARRGYAPFERDSIRLEHRLLERLQVETGRGRYLFVNYVELHPLRPLEPGDYAIIGDSLSDMATFRIR